MTDAWSWKKASAPGLAAVRAHWPPFLAIQAAAAGLVLLYARSPGLQEWCGVIERTKLAGGTPFAFFAGAVAGGIIPEVAKIATGRLKRFDRPWLATMSFNGLVYALVGVQVDLFYQFQTWCFGPGTDPWTLFIKTLVDMAIFSPVLSIPLAVMLFEWKRVGFRIRPMRQAFSWAFYRDSILPALIPCWAFWIPILVCVYSLPPNLQFVFALFAEAAWSILFVFIATEHYAAATEGIPGPVLKA